MSIAAFGPCILPWIDPVFVFLTQPLIPLATQLSRQNFVKPHPAKGNKSTRFTSIDLLSKFQSPTLHLANHFKLHRNIQQNSTHAYSHVCVDYYNWAWMHWGFTFLGHKSQRSIDRSMVVSQVSRAELAVYFCTRRLFENTPRPKYIEWSNFIAIESVVAKVFLFSGHKS